MRMTLQLFIRYLSLLLQHLLHVLIEIDVTRQTDTLADHSLLRTDIWQIYAVLSPVPVTRDIHSLQLGCIRCAKWN